MKTTNPESLAESAGLTITGYGYWKQTSNPASAISGDKPMKRNIPRSFGVLTAVALTLAAAPALAQNFLTDIPAGSRGMVSGPRNWRAHSRFFRLRPERQLGQPGGRDGSERRHGRISPFGRLVTLLQDPARAVGSIIGRLHRRRPGGGCDQLRHGRNPEEFR